MISQPLKISDRWLEKLKNHVAYRKSEAMRLGIARVEYERIERNCLKKIEESEKRQRADGESAIHDAGIDPYSERVLTVDLESGCVMEHKDGKEIQVFEESEG